MDRNLTVKEKWQDRRKVIIRWSLGAGAAVAAVVLLAVLIQPSVRESSIKMAAADIGSIDFAVSATGRVVPGYEETINAPISSRVEEVFKRAGDVVQAGEPLLRLDLTAAQADYDKQLKTLGIMADDAYTCTCYMDEVGNIPNEGDILSWAESSAVVYANSVLGARCNRNSGILDLFGSIVGCVPYFGLLTDDGRKADWLVEIRTEKKPEAQLLGSAIGMKVMEQVPYVVGLDKYFSSLDDEAKAYLKDFGAATASNGAVGLYHIEGLTPEAVKEGRNLLRENYKVFVIDDETLENTEKNYPVIWKDRNATPKLAFIGCPHLSYAQLESWSERIKLALNANGRRKVAVKTVMTAAPAVMEKFKKSEKARKLISAGVILSHICPLMYMNNPQCASMPVITCSNKLRTYTSAKYYKEDELLEIITGGAR